MCMNANPLSACKVDLDSRAVPVVYTGSLLSAEWTVANPAVEDGWYNYQAKQWANAITITTTAYTSEKYLNSDGTPKSGTVVDESDVRGYWVYITKVSLSGDAF